ncbi:MAG: cytochrome c peroxidase [Planctomycetota bacterium]
MQANGAWRRPRLGLVLSSLLAVGVSTLLPAQNTNNLGLQGNPAFLTAGGWIWPAADAGNPFTPVATVYQNNRIQLGKALFWDEQLSTSSTMACATCHIPEWGGIDPRKPGVTANAFGQTVQGSLGVVPQEMTGGGTIDYGFLAPPSSQETRMITPIHVPTMIGAYMFNQLFWDMRAGPVFNFSGGGPLFPNWSALENQSVGPPTSSTEMGHQNLAWASGVIENKLNKAAPLALVVPGSVPASIPAAWLTSNYRKVFDTVFAASVIPAIAAPVGVTRERIAMALASYMRTLVPDQAPIDTNTMTRQELLGFDVFVASGCVVCHSVSGGPVMVNRGPGPIGTLANPWDNSFSDGQGHDIFAANPARSIGRIKAPTLRNVGLRKRFFHDGLGRVVGGTPFNSIPDIVDFYDIDQDPANGGLGGPFELRSLGGGANLSAIERGAVIAFLSNALTDPRVANGLPPFDHPKLFADAVPFGSNLTKPSTPSIPGWTPLMIADVPPLVEKVGGSSWWKIGVGSNGAGLGGPAMPANSSAMLFFGTSDANPGPFYLTGPVWLGSQLSTPQGFATAHVPIVLTPAMIGTPGYLQWMVIDPSGWVGFSESAVYTPL